MSASTKRWTVTDAKAHFRELLEASQTEGPQIVTRRGVETAVVLPVEAWKRLQDPDRPNLKELLLRPSPRAEIPIPSRRHWRRRTPPSLD